MTKKVLLIVTAMSITLAVLFYSSPTYVVHSQGETDVQCGQILETEFTNDMEEHRYSLTIDARWNFDVSVEPFGEGLNTVIILYGPTGLVIDATNINSSRYTIPQKSPSVGSRTLSARGKYSIVVANAPINLYNNEFWTDRKDFGGVGFYTLSIGCTTNEGAKIRPGDTNCNPSTFTYADASVGPA